MPVITYYAVDRGHLVDGHSQGVSYQIECDLEAFPSELQAKGAFAETLDGTPEGWLDALQESWAIQTDLVMAASIPNWREFFTSVMAREPFSVDFTGTISSPGDPISVFLDSPTIPAPQQAHIGVRYAFRVKRLP